MSEQTSGVVNQQTGAAIPPVRGEVSDDTLREYPFIVPWTQGDYINIRYLAGCRGKKLADVGVLAVRRGLRELARETVADHARRETRPATVGVAGKRGFYHDSFRAKRRITGRTHKMLRPPSFKRFNCSKAMLP
jgi:hypothetical protein